MRVGSECLTVPYLLPLSLAADIGELSTTARRGARRVGPLPTTGIATAMVLVALRQSDVEVNGSISNSLYLFM